MFLPATSNADWYSEFFITGLSSKFIFKMSSLIHIQPRLLNLSLHYVVKYLAPF